MGQKVRNSDLTHLTWTYERELSKMQKKWGWEGVAPVLPDAIDDMLVEEIVECGLDGKGWWVSEGPEEVAPSERGSLEKEVEWLLKDQHGETVILETVKTEGDEQPGHSTEDSLNNQGGLRSKKSSKVCFAISLLLFFSFTLP